MKKIVGLFEVCLFLLFLTPQLNVSETDTIEIPAGTSRIVPLSLNQWDKVTGSLSVSGGWGNDIDFWVEDPSDETILNLGRVSGSGSFEFSASQTGTYELHLSNSFSIFSSKTVTLKYDVIRTLFTPMVMNLIYIAIIVIAVVTGTMIYRHYKKQSPATPSEVHQNLSRERKKKKVFEWEWTQEPTKH